MSEATVLFSFEPESPDDAIDTFAKKQPGYVKHRQHFDLKEDRKVIVVTVDGDVYQRETGQVIE